MKFGRGKAADGNLFRRLLTSMISASFNCFMMNSSVSDPSVVAGLVALLEVEALEPVVATMLGALLEAAAAAAAPLAEVFAAVFWTLTMGGS